MQSCSDSDNGTFRTLKLFGTMPELSETRWQVTREGDHSDPVQGLISSDPRPVVEGSGDGADEPVLLERFVSSSSFRRPRVRAEDDVARRHSRLFRDPRFQSLRLHLAHRAARNGVLRWVASPAIAVRDALSLLLTVGSIAQARWALR